MTSKPTRSVASRPRNLNEMIRELRSYLHRRQRQPQIIQRFFAHRDTAYAAVTQ